MMFSVLSLCFVFKLKPKSFFWALTVPTPGQVYLHLGALGAVCFGLFFVTLFYAPLGGVFLCPLGSLLGALLGSFWGSPGGSRQRPPRGCQKQPLKTMPHSRTPGPVSSKVCFFYCSVVKILKVLLFGGPWSSKTGLALQRGAVFFEKPLKTMNTRAQNSGPRNF